MPFALTDFKSHFTPSILKRGKKYFSDGQVILLTRKGNQWQAEVEGSVIYHVKITEEKGIINDTVCDCPAYTQSDCKHIAAVFFAITEELSEEPVSKATKKSSTKNKQPSLGPLDIIRKKAMADELLDFFFKQTDEIPSLKRSLLLEFQHLNPKPGQAKEYKSQLVKILRQAKGHDYYIPYHKQSAVAKEFDQYHALAERSALTQPEQCFSILFAFWETIIPAFENTDDSSGFLSSYLAHTNDIFYRYINSFQSSQKLQESVYAALYKKAKERFGGNFSCCDHWDNMLLEITSTEEQYHKTSQLFEKLFKENSKEFHYELELIAMAAIRLHQKFNQPKLVKEWEEKSFELPLIRKMLLQRFIQSKDWKAAEALCMTSLKLDEKYKGLVQNWKNELEIIYDKTNQTEKHKKITTELFKEDPDSNLFKKLEKTCSKEELEKIFYSVWKKYPSEYVPDEVLEIAAYYNKKELIHEAMLKMESYSTICNCEKYILKDYPSDFIRKISECITHDADKANYRGHYADISVMLRHLKQIGGIKEMNQLVTLFREIYKRRPAMLDELSIFDV